MCSRRAFLVALVMIASTALGNYSPPPEVGYPAGLVPECPGTLKNASIGKSSMPQLQIVSHKVSDTGQVIRRAMPILTAHKIIAREKTLDYNKKTMVYGAGYWDASIFPQTQAVANAYSKRGYNVLLTETFSFLTYIYPKCRIYTITTSVTLGRYRQSC